MKKFISNSFHLLFVLAFPAVLLKPTDAAAHLVTTGMGPVYDGIGHLLLTPEDLIPAISVAVYAGLQGRWSGRHALFLLPLAWFLGGVIGLSSDEPPVVALPAVSFLVLGALIATDLRLPANGYTLMITLVGLVHGFFNGLALKGGPGSLGLLGIMATLFVLVALVSAIVVSMKPPWTRIGVRVTGSWVAAIGILMIGWFIRGQ